MKDEKRCLNCRHEGKIHESQGWGGDEYWCECLAGMEMRNRGSFGCEKWQKKPTELKTWSFSHGGMFQSPNGTWCELDEVKDLISDKEEEIAELKQKLENVQASMYADVVDANMENRRLKRALWVTRTAMAKSEKDRWDAHIDCGNRRNRKDPAYVKTGKLLEVSEWRKLWADNERKCRAKAEEYK